MNDTDNPLLKALPPETDYLSYLTILEYNLTKEQLPTLHNVLQDTTLTANIGWDLVHLLLPLLPQSQSCLQDVARLGNPREVVLKVTELLEGIANEPDELEEEEPEDEEGLDRNVNDGAYDVQHSERDQPSIATGQPSSPPSPDTRFTTLLDMLSTLHPRIKTKYPSRFLSTSLQAILSAYNSLNGSLSATQSVLNFVKQLSGTKRPALPPRKSNSTIPTQSIGHTQGSAPDPEANQDELASGEVELHRRLLQSFLSYVAEMYIFSLTDDREDAPGMSWASRYQEIWHPDKCVPERQKRIELYAQVEEYHGRDSNMGQIVALARDLGVKLDELTGILATASNNSIDEDDNDLPSSPSDVPLSRIGALYILCAMAASPLLFRNSDSTPSSTITSLEYTAVINSFISDPAIGGIGTESEALLDALFFVGFYTLRTCPHINPTNDEAFNNALQRLSMLSAKLPSPTLRYHAHQLTSMLLHLHPSEDVRLAYIKDTLEHCPYENLKGSAVGWLKEEILAANTGKKPDDEDVSRISLLATPAVMEVLEQYLWPEVQASVYTEEDYTAFRSLQVFYLAILNLLYLLVSNTIIANNLQMSRFIPNVVATFLSPLMEKARHFEAGLLSGNLDYGDQEELDARVAEMRLLMMNVGQVMEKIQKKP